MDPALWQAIQRPQEQRREQYHPVLGSSLFFGAAHRLGSLAVETLFNPLTRLSDYAANSKCPIIMPDINVLLELHYSGRMTLHDLIAISSMHGVHLAADVPDWDLSMLSDSMQESLREKLRLLTTAWQGYIEQNKPYYPLGFLRKLSRQGNTDAGRLLREALVKEGFTQRQIQELYIGETELLSERTVLDLWFRQQIDDNERDRLLRMLGWSQDQITSIVAAERRIPDVASALRWVQLGLLTEQQGINLMQSNGLDIDNWKDKVLSGRFTPPSLTDVLDLSRRQMAASGGSRFVEMDRNTPDFYRKWAERLGYNMALDTGQDYGKEGWDSSIGLAAWQRSWNIPDLSLLAGMVHRYYAGRGVPSPQFTQGATQITDADITAILTANGYSQVTAPYVRDLLYSTVSMRHVRTFIATGTTSLPEVAGWLMDGGQRPDLAMRTAQALFLEEQAKLNAPIQRVIDKARERLIRSIEQAYAVGTLNADDATAELVANGLPEPVAVTTLSAIDIDANNRLVQYVVTRTRSEVFSGIITPAIGRTRLIAAGIAAPRAAMYAAEWETKFSPRRKTLATSQVLRYLRKGYITRDAAVVRLQNIGWSNADMLLLLADVQSQIASDASKVIAAAEASAAKEQRAIETQLAHTAGLASRLMSRLRELTPPATIIALWAKGKWTESAARKRLGLLGYTDDAIDDMYLNYATPKPKPVPPLTGSQS